MSKVKLVITMNDLRREKFEKWAITEFINITKYGATGVYCYPDAHLAWQAWCAAIESVVVELPPKHEYAIEGYDGHELIYALNQAGIKYE